MISCANHRPYFKMYLCIFQIVFVQYQMKICLSLQTLQHSGPSTGLRTACGCHGRASLSMILCFVTDAFQYKYKHRKNCECCPLSLLIVRLQIDCHEFRFSIERIVISVSIVTSLQDCLCRNCERTLPHTIQISHTIVSAQLWTAKK